MNLKNVLLLQYVLTTYSKIEIERITILNVSQKLNVARLVQLNPFQSKTALLLYRTPHIRKDTFKTHKEKNFTNNISNNIFISFVQNILNDKELKVKEVKKKSLLKTENPTLLY